MTAFADESTSGLVPLFPLPDVCLLPGEMMPLFVFEPRYRALLSDALAGEGFIALARFRPGWEDGYFGNPEVFPNFGVGRIAAHNKRPDGTSELVLKGVARVRLLEVVREMPYRLGRVEDLPEVVSSSERLDELVGEIGVILNDLCCEPITPCSSRLLAPGSLQDLPGALTRLLRFLPDVKQKILETDDLADRLGFVLRALRSRARRQRMVRIANHLGSTHSN